MYLYICDPCSNARPGEGMTKIFSSSDRGTPIHCPRCTKQTLEYRRPYKIFAGEIKGSRSMEVEEQAASRAKRPRTEPVRFADFAKPRREDDDEDEDTKPAKKKANRLVDDDDYKPQVDFTPSMRYTKGKTTPTMRSDAEIAALVQPIFEMRRKKDVAAKHGRLDAGRVMADHLSPKRYRVIGAHLWANWGMLHGAMPPPALLSQMRGAFYTRDKMRSLEWCHLIADSLGGKTKPNNLVAASYGANTYMMAIESGLHGKTAELEVVAHCSGDFCAELIVYNIRNRKGDVLTYRIDARNDWFPESSYEPIKKEVRKHVG